MYLKIQNKLKPDDFLNLADVLSEKTVDSITLLDKIDYEFVIAEPLIISVLDSSCSFNVAIHFRDPLGHVAWTFIGMEDKGVEISNNDISWHVSKEINEKELEVDIPYALMMLDRLVNFACKREGTRIRDVILIDSKVMNHQIRLSKLKTERKRKGEKPTAFGTIHSINAREAKLLAGDLIPLYSNYDKYNLYEKKKVYRYIPRKLVMKLLRCDGTSMIREDEFDDDEKEVVEDLVRRKYLKKTMVMGKFHYHELSEKTRERIHSVSQQRTNKKT